MEALQFFLLEHFHLKTIHSRWKMTRELRCNKWKFRIVVPFLCDQHSAHFSFLMFSFLFFDCLRLYIRLSTHCLCYYFNSLFLPSRTSLLAANPFFKPKTEEKSFHLYSFLEINFSRSSSTLRFCLFLIIERSNMLFWGACMGWSPLGTVLDSG